MFARFSAFATADQWLVALNLLCLVTAALAGLGWAFDGRMLDGASVWIKPLKFALSLAILSLTFGWLLTAWPEQGTVRMLIRGVALLLMVEQVLITLQAGRGVPSHFNIATPFDSVVFGIMGVAIGVAMVLSLVVAGYCWMQAPLTLPTRLAVTAGLLLMVAGGFMGYRMARPSRAQISAIQRGEPGTVGSHFSGPRATARTLPVLGWSISGGDWRWAHFVGLHGLQLLLLLSWALETSPLSAGARTAVVGTVALLSLLLFAWALVRAQQDLPVGVLG